MPPPWLPALAPAEAGKAERGHGVLRQVDPPPLCLSSGWGLPASWGVGGLVPGLQQNPERCGVTPTRPSPDTGSQKHPGTPLCVAWGAGQSLGAGGQMPAPPPPTTSSIPFPPCPGRPHTSLSLRHVAGLVGSRLSGPPAAPAVCGRAQDCAAGAGSRGPHRRTPHPPTPLQVRAFLQPPLKGVVLETFGSGNGPTKPDLLQELRAAAERGVLILNCTHCLRGSVTSRYAAGMVGRGTRPGEAGAGPGAQGRLAWEPAPHLPPAAPPSRPRPEPASSPAST